MGWNGIPLLFRFSCLAVKMNINVIWQKISQDRPTDLLFFLSLTDMVLLRCPYPPIWTSWRETGEKNRPAPRYTSKKAHRNDRSRATAWIAYWRPWCWWTARCEMVVCWCCFTQVWLQMPGVNQELDINNEVETPIFCGPQNWWIPKLCWSSLKCFTIQMMQNFVHRFSPHDSLIHRDSQTSHQFEGWTWCRIKTTMSHFLNIMKPHKNLTLPFLWGGFYSTTS